MEASYFVYFIIFLSQSWTEAFLGRHHYRRESESTEYFNLENIQWTLQANSIRGMVSAEVEVSDHDSYDISWYMSHSSERDGSIHEYKVPLVSAGGQNVYKERYWRNGKAYLKTRIMFRPVPFVQELELSLEIRSVTYGPKLNHRITLPIQSNSRRQTIDPEVPEVVEYPQSPVQYQPGDDVQLRFQARFKGAEISVHVFRGVIYSDGTELLDWTSLTYDPDHEETLDVIQSRQGDWNITTVVINMEDMQLEDKRMYSVIFSTGDSILQVTATVLPNDIYSIFEGESPRMSVYSCDPTARVLDTPHFVKFEMQEDQPNCVICAVGSSEHVSIDITKYNVPIGSGPVHSVYWFNEFPDISKSIFSMNGQSFQSYSFDGNYTCVATGYGGYPYIEREFGIVSV